jgi:protoporphyrinogen oxidase
MNVAVVGGGLAGLAAAYRLAQAEARVTVFEAGSRWGGQIFTERAGRFVVEHGAEGYAASRTSAREFCTALGLAGRLVSQITSKTFVFSDGALLAAPAGQAARLAGIQADQDDFGHGLASLQGGMGEVIDTLVAALRERARLELGRPVTRLARTAAGWTVTTEPDGALAVDAVVLAVPPAASSSLLEPVCAPAARALAGFETLSSVSVSLGLSRKAVTHVLDASGVVFPGGVEAEGLRACTFASSKFPHRAARGRVLLRAFFRPGTALPMDAPDERWVALATAELWPLLGVTGEPLRSWVARWPGGIPRYGPGHPEAVAAVRRALEEGAPGLELAGAAYWSTGVAGAIESAEDVVRHILARGRTPTQRYGSGGSDVS